MLSDNSGGVSFIRVASAVWLFGLVVTWLIVAITTKTIPDIPGGVLALTGTLIGGKVVQRFGESPEND